MSHLRQQEVEAYRRRTLSPLELLAVDDHASACPECRLRLAEGESLSGSLAAWEELGKGTAMPAPAHRPLRRGVFASVVAVAAALLIAAGLFYWQGSRAPVPAVEIVDGGETVRLGPRGQLVGLTSLPEDQRREIAAVLRAGQLDQPREIAELSGTRATTRGYPTDPSLTILEPIFTIVRDGRPTFRWTRFQGAESYEVQVFDVEFHPVAASGRISGAAAEWTPDRPLPAGGVYTWQITARRGDVQAVMPGHRSEEARFRVLKAEEAGELEAAVRAAGGSPLALGVIYARAGLVDDAERELARVVAANAHSAAAHRLYASVRDWRFHLPQVSSPTSTKPPQ